MSAPWKQAQVPPAGGPAVPPPAHDVPLVGTPVGASHYYESGGDYPAEKDYGLSSSYSAAGTFRDDSHSVPGSPVYSSQPMSYPPPMSGRQPRHNRSSTQLTEQFQSDETNGEKPASKRPGFKRQDSDSWERLLKGAGYTHGSGTETANSSFVGLNGRPQQGHKLLHPSVRLLLYIIVPTAILWIPGIIALTSYGASPANNFDSPAVWKVGIFWWSIWLSSIWVGWWICRLGAIIIPKLFRYTIGYLGNQVRRYVDYLIAVETFVALFMWTVVVYAIWLVIIIGNFQDSTRSVLEQGALASNTTVVQTSGSGTSDANNSSTTNLMQAGSRLWFGFVLSAALLLAEKVLIQAIAYSFHRVSYEDRISTNKFQIKVLTTLYENSKNLNRKDTYLAAEHEAKRKSTGLHMARQRLKKTQQKVKQAAQTSSSILGTVASEIAGQSVLQAGNPRSVVVSALSSRKQTQALARRIWYSFVPYGKTEIIMDDIIHCFPDAATAEVAFEMFDKDLNGDVTKDELEAACIETHRERLALQMSMRDVDSAVGRLDSIFMSVFVLIAAVIIAALLSVKFSTLVTSFGTIILGLSWLIGSTAQETLGAILFLLVKHAYDVGDRVIIGDDTYIVKEMHLLTTTFKTVNGQYVMISNSQLAQKPIVNLRRSGPTEETFKFKVAFNTTFQQIEMLRSKMVHWLDGEKRDFLTGLDINVVDFEEQSSLLLSTGIRYKSNWQQGALRMQRRNRWLCQLKIFLAECKIYGPSGDPAVVDVKHVTTVPYPPPAPEESSAAEAVRSTRGDGERTYRFMDKGAMIGDRDAFEDFEPGTAPGTAPPSRPVSPANALEHGRLRSGIPATSSSGAPPYARRPGGQVFGQDMYRDSYEMSSQPPQRPL